MNYIAHVKEYHDDINGNTYFSVNIEDIEYDKNYILPFQYGYETQSEHETIKMIKRFNSTVTHADIKFIREKDCTEEEVEEHGTGTGYNPVLGYYYQD